MSPDLRMGPCGHQIDVGVQREGTAGVQRTGWGVGRGKREWTAAGPRAELRSAAGGERFGEVALQAPAGPCMPETDVEYAQLDDMCVCTAASAAWC
jgi:hypothetical protein